MSEQYDKYIHDHKIAVCEAALRMVENLEMLQNMNPRTIAQFLENAVFHDASKFDAEEYEAYDEYFYNDGDEEAFNRAWLHHIHHNPHHWQHWLLVNDDGRLGDPGKVAALRMPEEHALEMIADWWSFSWMLGNLSEVGRWYVRHKDEIVLHEDTRKFVEKVLEEILESVNLGLISVE